MNRDLEEEKMPSFGKMASLETAKAISNQFRRLFISYSMAINKQEKRTGSLFQKNFKRKHINNEKYLTAVVYYIHRNPVHHKLCLDYKQYSWSSFPRIIEVKQSKLRKEEVLEWFGGRAAFVDFHDQVMPRKDVEKYIIEG